MFLISSGILFHNFGAYTENALSNSAEFDLGKYSVPDVADRVCLA